MKIPVLVLLFTLVLLSCSTEPKSQIGESCLKTADCASDARCFNRVCVSEQQMLECRVMSDAISAINMNGGFPRLDDKTDVTLKKIDVMMGATSKLDVYPRKKGMDSAGLSNRLIGVIQQAVDESRKLVTLSDSLAESISSNLAIKSKLDLKGSAIIRDPRGGLGPASKALSVMSQYDIERLGKRLSSIDSLPEESKPRAWELYGETLESMIILKYPQHEQVLREGAKAIREYVDINKKWLSSVQEMSKAEEKVHRSGERLSDIRSKYDVISKEVLTLCGIQ